MANNYKIILVLENVEADNPQAALEQVVHNVMYAHLESEEPDTFLVSVRDRDWHIFVKDNETGEQNEAIIVGDGE